MRPASPPLPLGQEVERLIQEARSGSALALGQLLQAFQRLLLWEASERLPADLLAKGGASDLVQQTYVEAVRDFAAFRGRGAAELKQWLLTMLGHNLANFRREYDTAKRQIGRELPLDGAAASGRACQHVAEDTPTPSALAIRREEVELLGAAMQRLGDEDKQGMQLRHVEQQGFATLGARLGVSEAAAQKRFTRAIEKLQEIMDEIRHQGKPPGRPGG
jgi:RNA polymerase sigma-70 factor (ECF subfamily)